jgi:hypothetical protein
MAVAQSEVRALPPLAQVQERAKDGAPELTEVRAFPALAQMQERATPTQRVLRYPVGHLLSVSGTNNRRTYQG